MTTQRSARRYKALMESASLATEVFSDASAFLDRYDPDRPGCLVLDVRMPEMDGMRLQEELAARRCDMPVIFITGHADIPTAVRAMKRGAVDFIEKPFPAQVLLDRIRTAIERNNESRRRRAADDDVVACVSQLTPREREVLSLLVQGCRLKEVAQRLHRSYKTVDCRKVNLMKKLNVHDRLGLVRIAIRAGLVAA
ncbi:MAG: response regulator transcription factor [Planctomycetes bacterium]|nr:response regulator transcription factor [Planctomycetota bacterium]